jgi:hypothetical protein
MNNPVIPSAARNPLPKHETRARSGGPSTSLGMTAVFVLAVLAAGCATPQALIVDEQTRGAIKQLTDAVAQQPTNMPWIYLLATYHDQAGQTGEVVRLLARLDELGWQHGVNPIAFPNSRGSAFRNAAAKLASREPHVRRASVAFPLTGHKHHYERDARPRPGRR